MRIYIYDHRYIYIYRMLICICMRMYVIIIHDQAIANFALKPKTQTKHVQGLMQIFRRVNS